MPDKKPNAKDIEDSSALARAVEEALATVSVTTTPVVIVGVNRRANIGNYEHIDIYGGVALPMIGSSLEDPEALSRAVQDAAEIGFREASRETFNRYSLIKDAANPRQEEEPK